MVEKFKEFRRKDKCRCPVLDDNVLKEMNRRVSVEEMKALPLINDNFDNISIDLIMASAKTAILQKNLKMF